MVDAGRCLHRRLHAPARHHDRERRAARHPARRSAPRCPTCSGSIDAYALSLAALLLTAGSLADRFGRRAVFAVGIVVFTAGSLLCGLAGEPTFLAARARLPGRRRRDHVRHRRWRCSRTAFHGRDRGDRVRRLRRRSPASPSPSGRCSAARSPAACRGAGSSSSTSRSASSRCSSRCRAGRGVARPARAARRLRRLRDVQRRPRRARLRADPQQRGRLGLDDRRRVADRRRRAARRLRGRPSASSASRCSTSRCCASRRSSAGWSPRSAISASLFALLTYLVLYLQNVLGYSAIETGVRFLPLTGAIFLTAGIAGRLTDAGADARC